MRPPDSFQVTRVACDIFPKKSMGQREAAGRENGHSGQGLLQGLAEHRGRWAAAIQPDPVGRWVCPIQRDRAASLPARPGLGSRNPASCTQPSGRLTDLSESNGFGRRGLKRSKAPRTGLSHAEHSESEPLSTPPTSPSAHLPSSAPLLSFLMFLTEHAQPPWSLQDTAVAEGGPGWFFHLACLSEPSSVAHLGMMIVQKRAERHPELCRCHYK